MYQAFGRTHAALIRLGDRLRSTLGQGTVEYIALILLVTLVLAGAIGALRGYRTDQGKELGDQIVSKIKDAVGKVKF